ncbi:hypothetical protein MMC30_006757 [Trapelia coarctata]|nr:hypothetical protein [Trapelia coarctata]
MSNSAYPSTPLQQHGYTHYSNPDNPYPLAALTTGQTPAEHSIYSEHDPSSTAPHGADHVSRTPSAADAKTRLRKACDSCSTRKVKCDDQGRPCRACAALEIPCTFNRLSRRRGPPNKHAEAIKKRRFDGSPAGSGLSTPASPTHAAQTLASFAQHQVLSCESICPFDLLQLLIDDYFTYIHPLIPIPHEPSFREALQARQDLTNPTFLALLASMIGCLVASFPRKPRQHLKDMNRENLFPNSMTLIERCHKITVEARGPGYLDKEMTVYDAVVSYLQGLTAAYTFNWRQCKLYLGECLTISRILGLHRSFHTPSGTVGPARGPGSRGPEPGVDYITQEMGRRTYWVMFVGIKSMQQMGASYGELFVPPATNAEPYPPLPAEVDDAYIYPSHIRAQPPGLVSEIVGFNANVRIFCSYNGLSAMELAYGINEIFDWDRQKRMLESCLRAVKSALDDVPQELMLRPGSRTGNFGAGAYDEDGVYRAPVADLQGGPIHPEMQNGDAMAARRRIQWEIQKANIYASQLGTRSHIVEKYWNLCDAHNRLKAEAGPSPDPPGTANAGGDHPLEEGGEFDLSEQDFVAERENIVKDLLNVLGTINQVDMEPNGGSFVRPTYFLLSLLPHGVGPSFPPAQLIIKPQINKIRQIASTLLDAPRTRKSQLALRAEDYLNAFLNVLMKLERVIPGSPGNATAGLGNGTGKVVLGSEEDEEAEFRHWADLTEYQSRFAKAGGVLSEF